MAGKKIAKKILKVARKGANKVRKDPELRALVKSVASQTKSLVLNEVKAGLSGMTGGKITGSGDYRISGNIRAGGGGGRRKGNSVASSIVIEREEFVRPLVSSTTAKGDVILKFRINPGNRNVFRWGADVALGYESYKPEQCFFMFESTSGDALNSTDTSLGKVVLAAQYNTYARDWDSFTELMNANDKAFGKPSENLMLGLECKESLRGAKTLYVSATDPATAGKAFYDLCDVFVGITGVQAQSLKAGELKVRYKFRLFNPIVRDSEIPSILCGASAAITSTSDPLIASSTWVENLSTAFGGSVSNTATVVTLNMVPTPGRVRLNVLYKRSGTSQTRTCPTLNVTAFSLGITAGAVTQDTSLTGVVIDNPHYSGAVASQTSSGYAGNYVIPPDTDQIVITFGGSPVGVSGDTVQLQIIGTPYESSDF